MVLTSPQSKELAEILQTLCHQSQGEEQHNEAFCQFYRRVTSQAPHPEHHVINFGKPLFESHKELLKATSILRSCCDRPKTDITRQIFPNHSDEEAKQGLRVTVKVAFMCDCASVNLFSQQFRAQHDGIYPVNWRPDQSFVDLIQTVFPCTPKLPYIATSNDRVLKAWKLQKRHGIRIMPTNDLVQHLYYDQHAKTLSVFHHVAWLKAQLRFSLENPRVESLEDSLKMYEIELLHKRITEGTKLTAKRGALPTQLLLETLYTIHHVLLPFDKKSTKLARRLVRKPKVTKVFFDPNVLVYDGLIQPIPEQFHMIYWNKRLAALQDIVNNPPPSNSFTSWFERHTSERNALTVAIIGVFLAALFGFLSFIVGIAQLIVSVLAWKYPA